MRIVKPYAIKQKSIMERLNNPILAFGSLIAFIALCVYAYPTEGSQYSDADRKAMSELFNQLEREGLIGQPTTDLSAFVYLYTDEGEVK